ncbi:hypothetical protein KKG41_06440 [Patescibacteria group bacterium]|nr:hypothetical protein [Patescibacteria group bacterium]MBU1890223.1 hypothetical protein [Patescibacteria group bacterium]
MPDKLEVRDKDAAGTDDAAQGEQLNLTAVIAEINRRIGLIDDVRLLVDRESWTSVDDQVTLSVRLPKETGVATLI